MVRGGAFNNNEHNVRAANRNNNDPDNRNNNIGFRVVVSTQPRAIRQYCGPPEGRVAADYDPAGRWPIRSVLTIMMLTLVDALDRLRRVTFKIRIEKNPSGAWDWGTGFFISRDGYALTAFHNLPANVVKAGSGSLDAYYKGTWIKLECLVAESLPEHDGDIAVLNWPHRHNDPDFLPVAYARQQASAQERNRVWAGRPVCAFGFPFEQHGQGERFVDGTIDSAQPYVEIDRKTFRGAGPDIAGSTEWLRFYSDRARDLKGISGAPILDRATGCAVAVEHRYDPRRKIVYATEIGRLVAVGNGRRGLFDRLPCRRLSAL